MGAGDVDVWRGWYTAKGEESDIIRNLAKQDRETTVEEDINLVESVQRAWEVRGTTQDRWFWIRIRESIPSTLSEFFSNGCGKELMVYDGKAHWQKVSLCRVLGGVTSVRLAYGTAQFCDQSFRG